MPTSLMDNQIIHIFVDMYYIGQVLTLHLPDGLVVQKVHVEPCMFVISLPSGGNTIGPARINATGQNCRNCTSVTYYSPHCFHNGLHFRCFAPLRWTHYGASWSRCVQTRWRNCACVSWDPQAPASQPSLTAPCQSSTSASSRSPRLAREASLPPHT
jgi:hypothetical protein